MSAYEKNKFADAIKDKLADAPAQEGALSGNAEAGPPEPTGHGSTPHEVAEDARRQDEARLHGRTRTDQLVNAGRADQTTGRG